jgi:hypothetical protein
MCSLYVGHHENSTFGHLELTAKRRTKDSAGYIRMIQLSLTSGGNQLLETIVDLLEKTALGMGGWLGAVLAYFTCIRIANAITNNGFTKFVTSSKNLHKAAQDDCVGRVMELLDRGADIDARDKKGRTPLLSAISGESYVNAWLLLSRGANPNIPDKEGNTPLHEACGLADMAMIHLLVEYGADSCAKNQDGENPEAMLNSTEAWLVDRTKVALIHNCCFGQTSA